MAQKQRNEDGPIDPMLSPDLIDDSSPESLGVKWLQVMGADSSLPSIFQGSGFKEALILRHLKVDRMEPGLVIFTLTVKSPITNRYRTLHGGAVATVAGIVGMAAVKTISGDKTYSLSEMSISYVSAARISVKSLLTIRPEDDTHVRNVTIRKIPRVPEHMPLYDILNEFQKGQSHMAVVVKYSKEKIEALNKLKSPLDRRPPNTRRKRQSHPKAVTGPGDSNSVTLDVSDGVRQESLTANSVHNNNNGSYTKGLRKDGDGHGGEPSSISRPKKRERIGFGDILDIGTGSLPSFPEDEEVIGIITMEDVIEELLQEEILDETDEYIDVHNKIKVNMLAMGRRSPLTLSSPTSAFSTAEASPLSSVQPTPPLTSPLLRSPISPHPQLPGPKPTLSVSPSSSLSGSPIFLHGSRLQVLQHEGGSNYGPRVPYEKLKK